MKNVLLVVLASLILSGCRYFQNTSSSNTAPDPSPDSVPSTLDSSPVFDGNIKNLLIRDSNFGTSEIIVQKDELLILSVRNQLEEPINIVIDELGIKTAQIEFGELLEVTIPTSKPGVYEMYSSLGTQRKDGFSTVLRIGDGIEE